MIHYSMIQYINIYIKKINTLVGICQFADDQKDAWWAPSAKCDPPRTGDGPREACRQPLDKTG